MSNNYYNNALNFTAGTAATNADMTAATSGIQAGFAVLPSLSATDKGFDQSVAVGEPTAVNHATRSADAEYAMKGLALSYDPLVVQSSEATLTLDTGTDPFASVQVTLTENADFVPDPTTSYPITILIAVSGLNTYSLTFSTLTFSNGTPTTTGDSDLIEISSDDGITWTQRTQSTSR